MDHFHYEKRNLFCEEIPVRQLAEKYGTPLWVYSKKTLLHHLAALKRAFAGVETLICYSIKTNPNLAICRVMAEAGAGFDVTSGGELYRALKAGGKGEQICFAGVGKNDNELRFGLDNNVLLFNVESEAELYALAEVA
ncbi:MAG: diaminopimelate decarboxylase, partial [Gemmataceae bacterium]